jgi:flagellin-like hook-associated protein FlgL
MTDERPTVRPVTLARLVEITHLCETTSQRTDAVETHLGVTRRRARETILEAARIGLINEVDVDKDESRYATTDTGDEFLAAVRHEAWPQVSAILETRSPHYDAFISAVNATGPASLDIILDRLEETAQDTTYTYNQTSVEVVGDWAERLGAVQRNAFTGDYYTVDTNRVPSTFPDIVLNVVDELEETAGINLRQRYVSVPELREFVCESLSCTRSAFDDALTTLAGQNIGKIELVGAPIDTGAKNADLGIKDITHSNEDRLVSTSQSTEQVMQGVEQRGKQYYYVAVHDCDLDFTQEETA